MPAGKRIFLLLILALFLFTRLYKVSEIPPSVYWDEASSSYNGYSVLKTGKDEWDKFMPVHFRAFGEFKLPGYIYSSLLAETVFGLNALSARLPTIVFSFISINLVYLLTKRMYSSTQATLSAFFLTVSPWFFIISRSGYDAPIGMAFFLLSAYLFLLSKQKGIFMILSTISIVLSIYSYNSFRVISPLALFILLALFVRSKGIKKSLLIVIISLVIFSLSLIPIARLYILDAGFGRAQGFSLFPSVRRVYDLSGKPHLQFVIDRSKQSNWALTLVTFTKNYFSHFSPQFLLTKGDSNMRNQQSGFGEVYLPEFILLILGIFILIKDKRWLILSLFLLGPIPAAITTESPHALRAIATVPFISIICGVSTVYLAKYFNPKFFYSTIIIIFLVFFINYFHSFINFYPIQSSREWQYGYKKIFTDYQSQFPFYDNIIISDRYAQPYIFALFYLGYDPAKFQKEVKRNDPSQWGFSSVAGFNKFKFEEINDKRVSSYVGKSLIFATDTDKPHNISPVAQIKFLDGGTAFWVYSLK